MEVRHECRGLRCMPDAGWAGWDRGTLMLVGKEGLSGEISPLSSEVNFII